MKFKYNIIPLLLIISVIQSVVSCSALGPVLPSTTRTTNIPAKISGTFYFQPSKPFFRHLNIGTLSLHKILKYGKKKHIKTTFKLQVLGQEIDGSVRVRSYEGNAYVEKVNQEILELHSKRCYIFGKRYWEDRMTPLQRWDCDHLVFRFNKIKKSYISVRSERTKHSDWFGEVKLERVRRGLTKPYFSGRLIHKKDSIYQKRYAELESGKKIIKLDNKVASQLAEADVIVWGLNAATLLKKDQIIHALDPKGKIVGKLKVISRPGDTILCKWIGKPNINARFVYTHSNLKGNFNLF